MAQLRVGFDEGFRKILEDLESVHLSVHFKIAFPHLFVAIAKGRAEKSLETILYRFLKVRAEVEMLLCASSMIRRTLNG
jgi:hypothetical protein